MKKRISTVLVLALCAILCVALVGCAASGGASAEGKWTLSSVTDPDGNEMTGEEIATVMGDTYYDLQSGGKLVVGAAGQEVEGTWKQDGSNVTLESNGQSFTATVDGNTMTLENEGAVSVFTK